MKEAMAPQPMPANIARMFPKNYFRKIKAKKVTDKIDIGSISAFLRQKSSYYQNLSLWLLNLEIIHTRKNRLLSSSHSMESAQEVKIVSFNEQECEKQLEINFDRISELLSGFNVLSQNSFERVCGCCDSMGFSYLILQNISKISSATFLKLSTFDSIVIANVYQLVGYYVGKNLIPRQVLDELNLHRIKNSTKTLQQQKAKKEEFIRNAWIRLIKDKKEKFENSSLNEIAKDIYDYVFPLLKNEKITTGNYVLTRTKKLDKDGKPIISGLSIDTIIMIMKKQKDFQFNPFIKKTA